MNLAEAVITGTLGIAMVAGATASAVGLIEPVDSMEKTGSVIEAWSVGNPSEALPVTDGYIRYNELETDKYDILPHDLQERIPDYTKFNEIWVKITPSANEGEFSLCTYQGDSGGPANNDIISYDSVTGEEVANEMEVCQ